MLVTSLVKSRNKDCKTTELGLLLQVLPVHIVTFVETLWSHLNDILSVTIQMKVTEQYFTVVLFIVLYKVILTFESVDEILKCDHSNESY